MLRPSLFALGLGALIGPLPTELATTYSTERQLTVDATFSLSMETVSSSFEVDGEPSERGGGGGGGSSEERHVVYHDRVLAAADGEPTKVRRTFEVAEGEATLSFGEEDMETSLDSPFQGLVLELTQDDGEVSVEVVDGDAPDDEQLEGQALRLTLDALLPDDDAETGDTWDIDGEKLAHALLIDVQPHLFPPPQRDEDAGGGGGRGGGRRGGGRGGFGAAFALLQGADLSAEAELVAAEEPGDDGPVARIRFEADASGELEQPAGGFGGGRGGGGEGETTYTVELEGVLVFSLEEQRPLTLEVEAKLGRTTDRSFDRGERSMRMLREEAGTFELQVEIDSKAVEDDE